MNRQHLRTILGLALCLLIAMAVGCASEPTTSPKGSSAIAATSVVPKTPSATTSIAPSYLRIHETNRVISLEIALRRFAPPGRESPNIWLVGVTHIGEPQYYTQLQSFLATQSLVLFEGVSPDSAKRGHASPEEQSRLRQAADQTLQGSMARSLGLAFQLASIDYSQSNFQHCDLSLPEIQELMRAHPPKPVPAEKTATKKSSTKGNAEFNLLMQAMDNTSWLNQLLRALFGVLESSPRLQALSKLTMIRMMGGVGDELQAAGQASEGMGQLMKVLLEARNEKVLTDLKAAMKTSRNGGGVAVFYGAGHMKDMASRLQSQLKYEMREEKWMQAFTVDLNVEGISGLEERMVDSLVAAQMRNLGLTPATKQ